MNESASLLPSLWQTVGALLGGNAAFPPTPFPPIPLQSTVCHPLGCANASPAEE